MDLEMLKTVAIVVAIAFAPAAHAAKCRSGKSFLYTQDDYCPSGYTNVTSDSGGTVSSIGKSETTKRQEADYLRGKAIEHRAYQAQLASEQRQVIVAENNRRYECNGLFTQARSIENAMRQINAWQAMDSLKQQLRTVRDQQFRLGC